MVVPFQPLDETLKQPIGIAGLKKGYVNGDLKFDPLGFKPTTPAGLKTIQTKVMHSPQKICLCNQALLKQFYIPQELNNGRLAMLGVAGIVAQELVTGQSIF